MANGNKANRPGTIQILKELYFYISLQQQITFVIVIITTVVSLHRSITNVNLFSDRLRYARRQRGLNQQELAQACGLSQGAISNYENGSRKSAKDLVALAQVLRVNAAWLAYGTGPMEADESGLSRNRISQPMAIMRGLPSGWPFTGISADEYWALSHAERAIIEDTVISLTQSFQRKR